MRMKRFTLFLLAAICCLMGRAAVSSVDDLVGTYKASASGWEGISDYSQWTALSTGHKVTISKNDDGTITIDNLLNFGQSLTGTVDVEAKTVTIAPTSPYYYYYTFADTTDVKKSVVGNIADGDSISFTNFTLWYGANTYIYPGATVTLKKAAVGEEDWTVEGTIAYSDSTTHETYYTGKTTLTKYKGSDLYDYVLKFDGPDANPAELQFKVYADKDSIGIENGEQTAGYAGAFFYYVYKDNFSVWLDTSEGCTSFTGDKTKGEMKIVCFSYASQNAEAVVGHLTFTWGESTGIKVPAAITSSKDAPIYDLSGRRVAHPAAGVYIQNGKKFVVK